MFLQTPTADTSGYMIAGFVISFLVMGLYVASIYVRNRNLNQDRAILEEMDKPAPAPALKPVKKAKAPAAKKPKTVTKKSKKK